MGAGIDLVKQWSKYKVDVDASVSGRGRMMTLEAWFSVVNFFLGLHTLNAAVMTPRFHHQPVVLAKLCATSGSREELPRPALRLTARA